MTLKKQRKIVMASLVLAIIFFATAPAAAMAQEAEQSVTANLVIQVQELQDELRELRGRMEEQERELFHRCRETCDSAFQLLDFAALL